MKKAILISIWIISTQVSLSQPDQEPPPQKLKVLSWNIYMLPGLISWVNGRRAQAIGEELADVNFDVVVFQEAFSPRARRIILQQLDERYRYHAGPANRRLFSIKTNSGLWILSRHPILHHRSIIFKTRFGADALSRKGALAVDLSVDGRRIQVIGTHLQNAGSSWRRHAQCVEICERLLKPVRIDGVPQIICGDFNIDRAESEDSYRFMLTSLGAEDGEIDGPQRFSYDRKNNDLHVESGEGQNLIDYILVRGNGSMIGTITRRIKVFRKRWSETHQDLSDHYPVEMEMAFGELMATALP